MKTFVQTDAWTPPPPVSTLRKETAIGPGTPWSCSSHRSTREASLLGGAAAWQPTWKQGNKTARQGRRTKREHVERRIRPGEEAPGGEEEESGEPVWKQNSSARQLIVSVCIFFFPQTSERLQTAPRLGKVFEVLSPPIPFSNRERTDDIEPRSKLQLNHNGGTFRLTRVWRKDRK